MQHPFVDRIDSRSDARPIGVVGVIAQYVEQGGDNGRRLERAVRSDNIPCLQPYFAVAHHRPRLCALDRFGQTISIDEVTTFIFGIDFLIEDKSKSNRRMECMLCAPGDAVGLRLKPTNPFDSNAVAIFTERGTQLGYVSAERAADWQADEGRRDDRRLPGDARKRRMHPDPVQRRCPYPARSGPRCSETPAFPPDAAGSATGLRPPRILPGRERPRVRGLTLGVRLGLIYVGHMKPSKFVPYYERLLGRTLGHDELDAIAKAREDSIGKRDAVKSMRAALLELVPDAHASHRNLDPA
ncbi:HIRAN domain-containing protein [Sphingomonas sp. CFBP 8764]|uniref:HIRAN domain-containing protein n=1 Tax=Sphingomonas sp. CFBP 8764 TaxID=2775275 RepID=UPI001781829C|nr:HIRAN domain-containing protein [Sphingomonas sp. CFBP 8764]MBD8549866.1 hypothetical protein [Sphingomonas sp. CFBP 8764]